MSQMHQTEPVSQKNLIPGGGVQSDMINEETWNEE